MSAYSELLKSPHWQKMRLEILSRDEWKCRLCKSTEKTLHVHHIRYKQGAKPWEYDEADLVTLCEECHESFTEEDKRFATAFTAFKRQNIVATRGITGLIIGMIYPLSDYPELENARPKSAEVQGFIIFKASGTPDPFGWAMAFSFSEGIKGMTYGEMERVFEVASEKEYEIKEHEYYLAKIEQVIAGK
jgi:hypothetical protein